MPSNSYEFLAIIFGSTRQINLHKFKIRFVVAKKQIPEGKFILELFCVSNKLQATNKQPK